jgi:RNA polymerase sigma factor (sigma-70 family)
MHKILYSKISKLTLPNYLDYEDIEQDLYFALCKAVQAYDDTKPYKFNSYLDYQIMGVIRQAMPNKHIKECSYNQTVKEDEETELIDLIADDTATERLQDIELTDLQTQVRQAVAELPTGERQAVTMYYLEEQSYKLIAKSMGVSLERARQRTRKGISILRKNRAIKGIYGELYRHYSGVEDTYYTYAKGWSYSREYNNAIIDIQLRRLKGEYISHGQEQSILALAKQKYIKQQAADELSYKYLCGVK